MDFSGRARRIEFWMFFLFNFLITLLFVFIEYYFYPFQPITLIYSAILVTPHLALMTRRLHDTGHSADCLLLFLIPIIGVVILIVFLAQKGTSDNAFGPKPEPDDIRNLKKSTNVFSIVLLLLLTFFGGLKLLLQFELTQPLAYRINRVLYFYKDSPSPQWLVMGEGAGLLHDKYQMRAHMVTIDDDYCGYLISSLEENDRPRGYVISGKNPALVDSCMKFGTEVLTNDLSGIILVIGGLNNTEMSVGKKLRSLGAEVYFLTPEQTTLDAFYSGKTRIKR